MKSPINLHALAARRAAARMTPATNGPRAGHPALVSCIMPTANRRRFVALGVRLFAAQDHDPKELIIVDDGTEPAGDLVRGLPGVVYVRLARRVSLGEKRNIACRVARGAVIAQWDDDDWFAPERLRLQAAPILAGEADVTGLECRYVLQLPGGQCWAAAPAPERTRFFGGLHGGTLAFRRSLFEKGLRYPHINLAEDAAFLELAQARRCRLACLPNHGAFVYVRHERNTWRSGPLADSAAWFPASPPPGLSADVIAALDRAAQRSDGS